MMKSAVLALLCVAVAGQDEAPLDAAPGDVVGSVDCRRDEDCRWYFDSEARCEDGLCSCSGQDKSRYCVRDVKTVGKLVIGFVFKLLNCDQFDEAVRTQIRSEMAKKFTYKFVNYDIVCGSVIFMTEFDVAANEVDTALQTLTENMQAVQQEIPVLRNAAFTTESTYGNTTQQCTVENSVSTIYLEDKICFPTCDIGFTRVVTNGTYTCVSNTVSSDDDDAITSEQIVAAVVGSVLVVGIIGGLAYHFFGTGKPNNDVPTNEPFAEEKPAEGSPEAEVTV